MKNGDSTLDSISRFAVEGINPREASSSAVAYVHIQIRITHMPKTPLRNPQHSSLKRAKGLRLMCMKRFKAFSERVFAEGVLPTKTKQLIAVSAAHVTRCPYCIRGHTKAALRNGASAEEIMEAIWVAAEMRAGAVYAHSAFALDTIADATHAPG